MVVADTAGGFRPLFAEIREMPEVHFGEVPRGYAESPFEWIAERAVAEARIRARERKQNRIEKGMPRRGFCELCRVEYWDAEMHRSSEMHRGRGEDPRWTEFDRIAEAIGGMDVQPVGDGRVKRCFN
jgi:hypothetical protein